MPTFEARMKYADIKVITVEAETEEEAQAKFDAGEWESEQSVDYYSVELLKPLRMVQS